ncbi:MAG: hypothetical protein WCY11_10420 [Novosphingobium sp.]
MSGDLSLPVMLATGILPGLGARRAPRPAWHPSSLFEGVIGGFWFDFTDTDKLRQTSVGVPPVATASDPVGLAFDQSRWAGKTFDEVRDAQPNLLPNSFASGNWNTSGSSAIADEVLHLVTSSTTQGALLHSSQGSPYDAAKVFEVEITVTDFVKGGVRVWTGAGYAGGFTANGAYKFIAANPADQILRVYGSTTDNDLKCRIAVREIPGKVGVQASSSLRPTYQVTHVRGDGSDDRLATVQRPTLAGTLIYAGTFEAASDVAIGATGAGGLDRCMLRTSTDGYLQASIGDQASAIIGETDIRGVDGVYAVRWGGDGAAVSLTRGNAVEYAGGQVGSVTTAFPFLVGAVNAGGSASSFLDGKMRHCLFVPRAISDSELAQAVAYFS